MMSAISTAIETMQAVAEENNVLRNALKTEQSCAEARGKTIRELREEVTRHRIARMDLAREVHTLRNERDEAFEKIKKLEASRQEWKAFTLGSRYGMTPDLTDAMSYGIGVRKFYFPHDWFVSGRRAGKTHQTNVAAAQMLQKVKPLQTVVNSQEQCGCVWLTAEWGTTAEARDLIRAYGLTPIARTVSEWNRAAKNLKEGRPERHGFRWTRSEEEKLVADYRAGKTLSHFVQMHKRENFAIALRAAKLVNIGPAIRMAGEDQDSYAARMLKFYFPDGVNVRSGSILSRNFESWQFQLNHTNYAGPGAASGAAS